MGTSQTDIQWPAPWPIKDLVARLTRGDVLRKLAEPRRPAPGHDRREQDLEKLVHSLLIDRFGADRVSVRKIARSLIPSISLEFLGSTRPDAVVRHEGLLHIAEVKSSRMDYPRYDDVLDSQGFREYIAAKGHAGLAPYEVEQDLIKLLLLSEEPAVGTCVFMMIDAFMPASGSWTAKFQDVDQFASFVRTKGIRDRAEHFVRSSRVLPISSEGAEARLIVCAVAGDDY